MMVFKVIMRVVVMVKDVIVAGGDNRDEDGFGRGQ